jgi:hypothetical protein
MKALSTTENLEILLIELEYATADLYYWKASIAEPNSIKALLSNLVNANRAVQTAICNGLQTSARGLAHIGGSGSR